MVELQSILEDFIQYCNEINDDAIFIVEGKRDTKTLRLLGVKGNIIEKGQRKINELVDEIINVPLIVILTDFDHKGKYYRNIIRKEIQLRKSHGEIDNYARQLLYKFCKAQGINEIEDLDRFEFEVQDLC